MFHHVRECSSAQWEFRWRDGQVTGGHCTVGVQGWRIRSRGTIVCNHYKTEKLDNLLKFTVKTKYDLNHKICHVLEKDALSESI